MKDKCACSTRPKVIHPLLWALWFAMQSTVVVAVAYSVTVSRTSMIVGSMLGLVTGFMCGATILRSLFIEKSWTTSWPSSRPLLDLPFWHFAVPWRGTVMFLIVASSWWLPVSRENLMVGTIFGLGSGLTSGWILLWSFFTAKR